MDSKQKKKLLSDIEKLDPSELAHNGECYNNKGQLWLTMALAYGVGRVRIVNGYPDDEHYLGGVEAWSTVLPEKYGLEHHECVSVSESYEMERTRPKGIEAAIEYIKSLKD